MVGKASCDSAARCVCVWAREASVRKRDEEGGEKAHKLEKVTLPVAQYVIPTGTGV